MKNIFRNYFSGYEKPGGIKDLMLLALPMVVSSACDGVMTFTDRLFLSRVGPEQMNAALGGGVTMQTLTFFIMGLTGYATALVAQYYGAGQKAKASKASFQAILITMAAWPVILLIKPLAVSFFHLANIPELQIVHQTEYFNILAWGSLFSMMRYTLGCYFTGIGKTRIVMIATLVAMLMNVVLDYVLIFGHFGFPVLGIRGAAIATVSGSLCALVFLIFPYFNRINRLEFSVMKSFRYDKALMRKFLYYGMPAGLEMFLNFLSFFLITIIFQSEGDIAATASTIMFNWDLVSFIPLVGIEVAVTSLVGRYMGAEKPDVAYRSAISGVKTGIFYSAVILLLFVFIPELLVNVFHPGVQNQVFDSAVPIAVKMIRIAALYVLADSMMVSFVGALRGAGDTHFVMYASVSANWIFLLVVYVSCKVFHTSVEISWLLMVLFYLVYCIILASRFLGGKWKKISVVNQH
jgi:MATE family multidrug resistance protein